MKPNCPSWPWSHLHHHWSYLVVGGATASRDTPAILGIRVGSLDQKSLGIPGEDDAGSFPYRRDELPLRWWWRKGGDVHRDWCRRRDWNDKGGGGSRDMRS